MTNTYKNLWKMIANEKSITPLSTVQYCLVKAIRAKSNQKLEIVEALLMRAFTPVTKPTKLANGRAPWDTLKQAIRQARYHSTFAEATLLGAESRAVLSESEWKEYRELLNILTSRDIEEDEPEYMFIFVRQDLSPEYQAVQGMHAVYKAGRNFNSSPDETHFVLVGVPNETALLEAETVLAQNSVKSVGFLEPDIGNELTAVASEPMKAHRKRFLRSYKKLTF